jgi:hypothetical protein
MELAMATRAFLIASLACSTTLDAQFLIIPRTGWGESGWSFDVSGQVARPLGEFRNNVPLAWGGGATARYTLPRTPLSLRADMSFLNYGIESKRVPLSTTVNRVRVDMNTTNNIALFLAGPELLFEFGPLRPYAHAFAGYAHFYTESSASGHSDDYDFATSTNFRDGGLTTGYGAGIRFPLLSRRHRAAIDMGGRMTSAGTRTYLTRGDIHDEPDGSLTFTPRTSETDFWQAHIGVTFYSRRRDR